MSFAWGPIQMLIACLMFILTVQRERRTQVRIGAVLLAHAVVYVVLPLRTWAEMIAFWQYIFAIYLCLSLLYVHFILACSWRQALYCTTCALAVQHIFCNVKLVTRQMIGQYFWVDLLLMILVYIFFYRIFAARLFTGMFNQLGWIDLFSSVIVVLFVFGINLSGDRQRSPGMFFMWRLADTICCCYILWLQAVKQEQFRLQKEKDDLERIVDQQKHQYEITRDMIERINEHCHDIKHQIHSVSSSTDNESLKEYLGTLADHVMVYDMAIRTGNKALDTVLMEKGLLCREKQIQWIAWQMARRCPSSSPAISTPSLVI